MGFFGLGQKKGIRCDPTPEGNLHCRTFTADNSQKFATGTDVTITIDPQTCRASFTGEMDLIEDDEGQIEKVVKQAEAACRKGLV